MLLGTSQTQSSSKVLKSKTPRSSSLPTVQSSYKENKQVLLRMKELLTRAAGTSASTFGFNEHPSYNIWFDVTLNLQHRLLQQQTS